MDMC